MHRTQILRNVGQFTPARIVGGDYPGGFLADRPDAIDDVIKESPGAFHAFREHQLAQHASPGKVGLLIPSSIAGAGKVHVECGWKRRPGVVQQRLDRGEDRGTPLRRQPWPGNPVVCGWEGVERNW
jgi:hypothetical protein